MGPRSGDRGNMATRCAPSSRARRLQWGRDLVIAEIVWNVTSIQYWYLLQWGRDLVIAEICRAICSSGVGSSASMGPRSGDRGNKMVNLKQVEYHGASMGPRSGDRGNTPGILATSTRKGASMGPRSGDRGNLLEFFIQSPVVVSFNGAAIW